MLAQDKPGPVLSVSAFSKLYEGGVHAVKNLSFEVHAGEVLGLVGSNGAGKTSTLRSIAGILPVKHGRILVGGHDVAHVDEERLAKRLLAWVPDDPQPFETLTVEEHLEFTAALFGLADWRTRGEELLTTFELQEKRKALGGELSRGMRQKLAFSCAFLPRPRLLLLDEPLTGLDPRGIQKAKAAIQALAAGGTAVILSSHLLELVEELGSRLLILDRGERVFLGTFEEARSSLFAQAGSSLEEIFFAATAATAAQPGGAAVAPVSAQVDGKQS